MNKILLYPLILLFQVIYNELLNCCLWIVELDFNRDCCVPRLIPGALDQFHVVVSQWQQWWGTLDCPHL